MSGSDYFKTVKLATKCATREGRREGKSGNAREGRKSQGRSLTWGPSTYRIEIYENILLKHTSFVFYPFLCLFVQCEGTDEKIM